MCTAAAGTQSMLGPSVGPGARLAVIAVTVLGVGCGLLAWIEGLTPRAIARSLKR